MGAAYLLPRVVGLGHATRLLMLGDTVRAPEAERIGLISELTEEGRADEAAQALARRLADGPALANAQTKPLLTAELDMPLEAAVVSVPDEARGALVKAFVVLAGEARSAVGDPAAEAAKVKELQDFVKAEIAPYKYPRAMAFIDDLPRTSTGKLQRFRLRQDG
jgi:non-ribosomal peptide synthetase component E (peptide arylation enzyme)